MVKTKIDEGAGAGWGGLGLGEDPGPRESKPKEACYVYTRRLEVSTTVQVHNKPTIHCPYHSGDPDGERDGQTDLGRLEHGTWMWKGTGRQEMRG